LPNPEEPEELRERPSTGLFARLRPGRTKAYRTGKVLELKSGTRKTSEKEWISPHSIVFFECEEDTKIEVGKVDLTKENLHVSNLGEHLLISTVSESDVRNLADLIHPGSHFENIWFEIQDGFLYVTISGAKPFEVEPPPAPIESEKQRRSHQND
jgi:hypothetical protein